MENIIKAEILSEGKQKLRITLANDAIIEGYSLGMISAIDDDGEELGYDVLVFDAVEPEAYFRLKNEDIKSVEKA